MLTHSPSLQFSKQLLFRQTPFHIKSMKKTGAWRGDALCC